ncbi:MAG: glycosyltransferase family 4 protein [Candidatus Moranbacteria bacterium]|nr:glycosyltransferase family 4 protein [Candidatus Moranbacteria bacterium]
MKIGIDIRNIGRQRTGSEVVVLELTKNVLKLDRENEYFLLTDTDDKAILENIKKALELDGKNNAKIVSLKAKNKFVWAAWVAPRYLHQNKLDVYHAEYILPLFIPKETRAITHIHDVSFKAHKEFIKKSDLLFLNILIPLSLKKAHKVIAISEFTKEEIIKYYGVKSEKIELIYNAVQTSRESSRITSSELRQKYGLPEKYILYVGTLQPRKNIPALIEAFGKIAEKISDTKLVIAGNKKAHNFDKKIDETIKKNDLEDKVVFTGFIDEKDKADVFALAHVFAYPSFYEGFGLPLLEAMNEGVPVIAADSSSLKEIGGDACMFFDPADLDDFSQKLYTICVDEELRNKLVSSGKKRVNFFSWEKSAGQLQKIYQNKK